MLRSIAAMYLPLIFGVRKGDHQSFLESGTSFEGKIAVSGLVRLEGELRGEVDADSLVVGQSGRVEAKLSARSLIVHGTVIGLILAKERVEVGPTGSIEGIVCAPKLRVDEGARLAVQFERRFGNKQVWLVRSREAWRDDMETPLVLRGSNPQEPDIGETSMCPLCGAPETPKGRRDPPHPASTNRNQLQ